jgi:hypothetical protein
MPEHRDTSIPKFLQRRDAVQCLRCRVEVPADKLNVKDRCLDPNCPLKPKESQ